MRSELDEYFEKSNDEVNTFADATAALDAYAVQCAASFPELKQAYSRMMKAKRESNEKLRSTWHVLERELGLLAAKIADSAAFHRFHGLEVRAVDLAEQRTEICSNNATAATAGVKTVFKDGLTDQTWNQLLSVFQEMAILLQRFEMEREKLPSGEALMQAWDRVSKSYSDAVAMRDDIAKKHVEQFYQSNCEAKGDLQDAKTTEILRQEIEHLHEEIEKKDEAIEKKDEAIDRLHEADREKDRDISKLLSLVHEEDEKRPASGKAAAAAAA
jgi:hypothetical protein